MWELSLNTQCGAQTPNMGLFILRNTTPPPPPPLLPPPLLTCEESWREPN